MPDWSTRAGSSDNSSMCLWSTLSREYWKHDGEDLRGNAVASELVHDLAQEHRPGVVDAIVALAEAVSGDADALGYLGAGVLEDTLRFCRARPTPALVDTLEAAVRRSPDLRVAVGGGMWWDDSDPNRLRFQRLGRRVDD